MVVVADLGFTTYWILAAIGLYSLVGVIAGVFFASLRRQTELVATDGPASGAYEAAGRSHANDLPHHDAARCGILY